MTAVKVLAQHQVNAEVGVLAAAWSNSATFALIPDKTGPNSAVPWLETLPPTFRSEHFVLLTSGSTSIPKLIVGRRDRAEALVRVLHRLQDLEGAEETLVTLPLTYSYAFVNQWLWSRIFRRRLVLTRGLAEPDQLRTRLAVASRAMLCLVGAQVPLLLQHFGQESFSGVMRLNFAGGRFPQEHLPALARLFPRAQVFNNYGCAEALPRLTVRKAEDADEPRILGSPIEGVELFTDARSNLLFRSPYGAVGIVEDGAFRQVADEDWIATGDLGEQRADGRWQLLGRASEMFKRYGEKLSLTTIAATVNSAWPGQCGFYREADPAGEDGYVLVLAPLADATALRAVLHAFRAAHTRPHWPLRIETVAAMPLMSNGKIDTSALKSLQVKTELWKQRL